MKSQTMFEYSVVMAVGLIIAIVGFSFVYDLPGTITNVRDRSHIEYWQMADIGILSHAFNGTNVSLFLINNMRDTIQIQEILISDTLLEPNITLMPAESYVFTSAFELDLVSGEPYEFLVQIMYQSLDNNRVYGFYGEAPLIGFISLHGNLSQ